MIYQVNTLPMRCENALRALTITMNSSSTSHYGSEIELTCVYLVKYCLNRGGRPARLQLGFFLGGASRCVTRRFFVCHMTYLGDIPGDPGMTSNDSCGAHWHTAKRMTLTVSQL